MTTTNRVLEGARWSSAVMCSRMASYQALGVEGDPHPEHVERRFGRGRRIGEAMAAEIIETLAAQGRHAVAEHEVPWPGDDPVAVGHVDIYEVDANHPIEVVSTEGCSLPPNKARQVAGYAVSLGSDRASVVSVDPKSGESRVYPINVEAFRPEVERIQGEVVAAIRDGVIPDRFEGSHPGAYPCAECPFLVGCMADYTPPPAGTLPGRGADLMRLLELDTLIRSTPRGDHVLEYEAERDEIRESLRGLMSSGEVYIEDGVQVKRTEVSGRRSFAFAAAEAAGYEIPESMRPFITEGKGFDKWTVKELR